VKITRVEGEIRSLGGLDDKRVLDDTLPNWQDAGHNNPRNCVRRKQSNWRESNAKASAETNLESYLTCATSSM
jgi:hypothetical protein